MDSESRLPVDISHVLSRGTPAATTQVQNGVSGSYMEAVFEIVTHIESEIWIILPHKEGLLQLPD